MLKIKTLKRKITPPVGTFLAGYGANVVSDAIHDDLWIVALACENNSSKLLILSYDLLGLDEDVIFSIRARCAAAALIDPEQVVVSCTHTHSGPHTRRNHLADLNYDSIENILQQSTDLATEAFIDMINGRVLALSVPCYENINRRVLLPDNSCYMLPQGKYHTPLATGVTDSEMGLLYFVADSMAEPIATLMNYAAHPLTCQSGGSSSRKISADYPGVVREYVENELGGGCIFTSGACGDLHPRDFESGFARTQEMGESLGRLAVRHYYDALNDRPRFEEKRAQLGVLIKKVKVKFRSFGGVEPRSEFYAEQAEVELLLHLCRIGDIAFVGVPGELLAEIGLEIKWHSPFRHTYILYNSTAYISYIPHANAYVSGGYESDTSHLAPDAAFVILVAAVAGLNELFRQS